MVAVATFFAFIAMLLSAHHSFSDNSQRSAALLRLSAQAHAEAFVLNIYGNDAFLSARNRAVLPEECAAHGTELTCMGGGVTARAPLVRSASWEGYEYGKNIPA